MTYQDTFTGNIQPPCQPDNVSLLHVIRHLTLRSACLYCPSCSKAAPGPPAPPVKALPLRSDERENRAALTARTARRLAPPGRAFAFNASLPAVPLRSKKRNQRKEFFQCNKSANNLLLNSARSSQHRALRL